MFTACWAHAGTAFMTSDRTGGYGGKILNSPTNVILGVTTFLTRGFGLAAVDAAAAVLFPVVAAAVLVVVLTLMGSEDGMGLPSLVWSFNT